MILTNQQMIIDALVRLKSGSTEDVREDAFGDLAATAFDALLRIASNLSILAENSKR